MGNGKGGPCCRQGYSYSNVNVVCKFDKKFSSVIPSQVISHENPSRKSLTDRKNMGVKGERKTLRHKSNSINLYFSMIFSLCLLDLSQEKTGENDEMKGGRDGVWWNFPLSILLYCSSLGSGFSLLRTPGDDDDARESQITFTKSRFVEYWKVLWSIKPFILFWWWSLSAFHQWCLHSKIQLQPSATWKVKRIFWRV